MQYKQINMSPKYHQKLKRIAKKNGKHMTDQLAEMIDYYISKSVKT